MWDTKGHARGILARVATSAAWIRKGKSVEMFCAGFRNPFDMAFDVNGEPVHL